MVQFSAIGWWRLFGSFDWQVGTLVDGFTVRLYAQDWSQDRPVILPIRI